MTPLAKRKWKIFFKKKRAFVGISIFLSLFFVAYTAPFWVNNKPIFIAKYNVLENGEIENKYYFPVLFDYPPIEFGIKDTFVVDYQAFIKNDKNIFLKIFPVNKWDPEEQGDKILAPPSAENWFGTDNLGRDIFARLIYGTRTSLSFAFLLWIVSYFIGTILGAMQGYFFGKFDFFLERFKELTSIIPTLTLIVLITAITKNQSFYLILFLVIVFGWIGISHQVRANVLTVRTREYCDACFAFGGGHSRILWKHILPNSMTAILTLSPFAIHDGIALLAVLDYLGFGLPPPTPSIGELLSQGRDNIQNAPWVLLYPVFAILLLLVSINLIGQSLREAFDPKSS